MSKPKKNKQTVLFPFHTQESIDWGYSTQKAIQYIRDNDIKLVYIDLFCGAGGLGKGVDDAEFHGKKLAYVALGINHDLIAIASQRINFPNTLHMVEDVREVKLEPIAKFFADIRTACPGVLIILWISAECTGHSKAKGGDSRDADSRSLPEELYRYQEAIQPDIIQVENVTEFRIWGPLKHKIIPLRGIKKREYKQRMNIDGVELRSKNKTVWIDFKTGLCYKKKKGEGIRPWEIPIKERKAEFFNAWKAKIIGYGYHYEDRDINAANVGARTSRVRYYGQFSKTLELQWPQQTHCKDPEKHLKKTGEILLKHLPVRDVLDFSQKGESVFTPGKIESDQTFIRVNEGGIKFVANGKEAYKKKRAEYEKWLAGETEATPDITAPAEHEGFLMKYNSASPADKNYKHTVQGFDKPSPAVPTRNMLSKVHPEFLPFIVQYNNNCTAQSIDEPNRCLTKNEKFALAFMEQKHNGTPTSRIASIDNPSRTITQTGGNLSLVQVEEILPFISNYHGNGHNCHSVENSAPAVCAADIHSLVNMQPFIFRQFGDGGGQLRSVDESAGGLNTVPKMNLISPEAWIMDTAFNNIGKSIDEPHKTETASRHHAYVINPSYYGHSSSVDLPSPVVVARQDKAPLHLAQVEHAGNNFYGIVIYKTDTHAIRELKIFMAVNGICDIKMRMLLEEELLQIQGFPPDFFHRVRAMGVKVTVTDAKKFVGNSQEVTLAKRFCECYAPLLNKELKKAA